MHNFNAAYCYRCPDVPRFICMYMYVYVCLSVCPAKTAGPIELPFGKLSSGSPRNHVLDGDPDPPTTREYFVETCTRHL